MRTRHVVVLSEQERTRLHTMIGLGIALTHARILVRPTRGQAGPGWTDAVIGARGVPEVRVSCCVLVLVDQATKEVSAT